MRTVDEECRRATDLQAASPGAPGSGTCCQSSPLAGATPVSSWCCDDRATRLRTVREHPSFHSPRTAWSVDLSVRAAWNCSGGTPTPPASCCGGGFPKMGQCHSPERATLRVQASPVIAHAERRLKKQRDRCPESEGGYGTVAVALTFASSETTSSYGVASTPAAQVAQLRARKKSLPRPQAGGRWRENVRTERCDVCEDRVEEGNHRFFLDGVHSHHRLRHTHGAARAGHDVLCLWGYGRESPRGRRGGTPTHPRRNKGISVVWKREHADANLQLVLPVYVGQLQVERGSRQAQPREWAAHWRAPQFDWFRQAAPRTFFSVVHPLSLQRDRVATDIQSAWWADKLLWRL